MARIGFGKLGRSMPLQLDKCGTVGGDVENLAVILELSRRYPNDTVVLVGRNSGEDPKQLGLPTNVENPWVDWSPEIRKWADEMQMPLSNLEIEDQNDLREIYQSVVVPEFLKLDAIVMWEGQHGSSNLPMPMTDDSTQTTKPHDWEARYCGYFFEGLNAWRDQDPLKYEEIILNADARNVRQSRDYRWPARHPVLAQFNTTKNCKFNRGCNGNLPTEEELVITPDWAKYARRENQLWAGQVNYCYSGVEINALTPGAPFGDMVKFNDVWEGREHFGIFINEARAYVKPELTRLYVMQRYVLPLQPAFIHGKWSPESQKKLGISIDTAPWDQYFPLLHTVRSTFTTPSSGSGWVTTKIWEAWAAGTVCFFHPSYDTQNHAFRLADPKLREFLRVYDTIELKVKVKQVNESRELWEDIVRMQRETFDKAIAELKYMQMVQERLALTIPQVQTI